MFIMAHQSQDPSHQVLLMSKTLCLGLSTHMGKKDVDFDKSVEQSLPTPGTNLLLL